MGYNASFLYPLEGIGELAASMSAKLKEGSLELGTKAVAVDHKRRRVKASGKWLSYENLVSSIPLDNLVGILVDPPAKVRAAGEALRCTSLRYLDIALNKPSGTDYHWAYVPEKKYPFYRVGAYSNFSAGVAPPGKGCLYVELASRRAIDMRRVLPRVADGLKEMGIIDKPSDISFARPRFIKHAYVIYDRNRERALETILPWLEKRGIFVIGRYGRWEYAAMEDAIVQGIDIAGRIKSGEV